MWDSSLYPVKTVSKQKKHPWSIDKTELRYKADSSHSLAKPKRESQIATTRAW